MSNDTPDRPRAASDSPPPSTSHGSEPVSAGAATPGGSTSSGATPSSSTDDTATLDATSDSSSGAGTSGESGAPPPPPTGGTGAGTSRAHAPRPPRALPTALVALGVGLLAGGVAVAAAYSRDYGNDGALDLTAYVAGAAGAVVLLLIAVVASLAALRAGKLHAVDARGVAGWSGAIGILAGATMLRIGLENLNEPYYVLGGLITALSVLGFLLARHGAFVVTAIVGLGVLYVAGFRDLFGDIAFDDAIATVAAALGVFVLAVTLLGWLLPTRVLSAQVVGWIGVVGAAVLLGIIAVLRMVNAFFDDLFGDMGDMFGGPAESESPFGQPGGGDGGELGMPGMASELPDFTGDVAAVLVVAGVLVLLWLAAAALTKHPGFTLLAVAMPVATVPLATAALVVDRPTLWSVALLVPGALALIGATLLAVRRRP